MFSQLLQGVAVSARATRGFSPLLTRARPAARLSWQLIARSVTAPGNRLFSSAPSLLDQKEAISKPPIAEADSVDEQTASEAKLQSQEPRLQISFTCTVTDCNTRSTHEFTRRSYERGIVIVQCPGCKNRHLIADHIGWFKESTEDGKLKTIEDLMRNKGEVVRRGRLDAGEVIEYTPE